MKGDYKYISMIEKVSKGKTKIWGIINKSSGVPIGYIRWYGAWRQYCLYTHPDIVFSAGCLADIKDFIIDAMNEWRNNRG